MSLSHRPPSGSATCRRNGRSAAFWGRQPRIALDPTARAFAEAGLGGSPTLGMMTTEFNVRFHLLVGGGRPGKSDLFLEVEVPILPSRTPRPERRVKTRAVGLVAPTVGLRPPSGRPNRPTYVSLTGRLCCRAAARSSHTRRPQVDTSGKDDCKQGIVAAFAGAQV